ncbi:MAG: RagB/SusD family nutrient uptake outer membrane protein [Bacteroidales bacterium]
MNKIKYWPILFLLTLCSCESWLAIEPEYEITDADLYKNTDGYYKVLNGIYHMMSSSELYGKELSWGAVEAWARVYKLREAEHKSYLQLYNLKYDQKDAKDWISSFWSSGYKVIAQTNNLIYHTQKREDSFFKNGIIDKNIILGEAYATRAMMHFEILRAFAQAPVLNKTEAYIPYIESYPSVVNPKMPTEEILKKIISDLLQARELVATFDLDPLNSGAILNVSDRFFGPNHALGKFYSSRGTRLNYLAITGLLARVCLYADQQQEALGFAQEIIQLVTDKKLSFSASSSIESDPRMFSDLLFGFYNEKLADNYEPFASGEIQTLYVEDVALHSEFKSGSIFTDKRHYYVKKTNPQNVLTKYTGSSTNKKAGIIANIRLSEMYYIAAECVYQTNMKQATDYLNTVRKARGISSPTIPSSLQPELFYDELVKEYRKDLIGEGQILFFYKRTNKPIKTSTDNFQHNGTLILPVPDSEDAV